MILVSLEIVKKCVLGGCLKFFLTPLAPSGLLRSKKFQTKLILAFEANSVLSPKNETKIVKITHSECIVNKIEYIIITTSLSNVAFTSFIRLKV